MKKDRIGRCELCCREEIELTAHHLVPKDKGGVHGATALLCRACHRQIHAMYSNSELALQFFPFSGCSQMRS
ncbi:HNH endonuclease [Alteribacillus sp. HJP-4]|uniref:HNH endonuclease n=1 Tax=Alteribacillus sp. HJP-4 TaxID=2775394 RepID=UPI0035CD29CE